MRAILWVPWLLDVQMKSPVYSGLMKRGCFVVSSAFLSSLNLNFNAQIKTKYEQTGIVCTTGTRVVNKTHRDHYLNQLPKCTQRDIIMNLYKSLDEMGNGEKSTCQHG